MPKLSEAAKRIRGLRESLHLERQEFADRMEIVLSLVGMYETGNRPPSVEMFVKFGNLAAKSKRPEDAVWFYKQAGLDWKGVKLMADDEALKELRETEPGKSWPVPPVENIPGQENLEPLRIPISRLTNLAKARYARVTDDLSFSLVFGAGDIVLLDQSEMDWRKLEGRCVAFYRPREHAFTKIKYRLPESAPEGQFRRCGVFAAWVLDGSLVVPVGTFSSREQLGLLDEKTRKISGEGDVTFLGRVTAWFSAALDENKQDSKK